MTSADQVYATGAQVRGRYGVSDMTIWRWSHDAKMGFPQPIYINRRRYWPIAALDAFDARMAQSQSEAA